MTGTYSVTDVNMTAYYCVVTNGAVLINMTAYYCVVTNGAVLINMTAYYCVVTNGAAHCYVSCNPGSCDPSCDKATS